MVTAKLKPKPKAKPKAKPKPRPRPKGPPGVFLSGRVHPDLHRKFHKMAQPYGGASELIRMIAEAVVNGQIVITMPVVKPTFEVNPAQQEFPF